MTVRQKALLALMSVGLAVTAAAAPAAGASAAPAIGTVAASHAASAPVGGNQYGAIQNDQFWKDTAGNPIHSQGGGVFKFGDTYYWYGVQYKGAAEYENNPTTLAYANDSIFQAITVYSSQDLVHWKFENDVALPSTPLNIPTSKDVVSNDFSRMTSLADASWIGRLGVVYNQNTHKYVIVTQMETSSTATPRPSTRSFSCRATRRPATSSTRTSSRRSRMCSTRERATSLSSPTMTAPAISCSPTRAAERTNTWPKSIPPTHSASIRRPWSTRTVRGGRATPCSRWTGTTTSPRPTCTGGTPLQHTSSRQSAPIRWVPTTRRSSRCRAPRWTTATTHKPASSSPCTAPSKTRSSSRAIAGLTSPGMGSDTTSGCRCQRKPDRRHSIHSVTGRSTRSPANGAPVRTTTTSSIRTSPPTAQRSPPSPAGPQPPTLAMRTRSSATRPRELTAAGGR